MRDFTHSCGRFAWVLSLFGLQQLTNLLEGPAKHSASPRYDPVKAIDDVTHSTKSYLGSSLQQVFRSGEGVWRAMVDSMLGWGSGGDWPDLDPVGDPMAWSSGMQSPRSPGSPRSDDSDSFGSSWPSQPGPDPYTWNAGRETANSPEEESASLPEDALRWVGDWGPMPEQVPSPGGPTAMSPVEASPLRSLVREASTSEPATNPWGSMPQPSLPSSESPNRTSETGNPWNTGKLGPTEPEPAPFAEGDEWRPMPDGPMRGGPMPEGPMPGLPPMHPSSPPATVPLDAVGSWGPMPEIPSAEPSPGQGSRLQGS